MRRVNLVSHLFQFFYRPRGFNEYDVRPCLSVCLAALYSFVKPYRGTGVCPGHDDKVLALARFDCCPELWQVVVLWNDVFAGHVPAPLWPYQVFEEYSCRPKGFKVLDKA